MSIATATLELYKGFEIHPLVFARKFDRFDRHSRYAEGYDIAVGIRRVDNVYGSQETRIFRLNLGDSISDFGVARRMAKQQAKDIIDGNVEGSSVVDL